MFRVRQACQSGTVSPLLGGEPSVHVLTDLILGYSVSLLEFTLELIAAAIDDVQIVIGQLAPLLLDLAFDTIPVHFQPPSYFYALSKANRRLQASHSHQDRLLAAVKSATGPVVNARAFTPNSIIRARARSWIKKEVGPRFGHNRMPGRYRRPVRTMTTTTIRRTPTMLIPPLPKPYPYPPSRPLNPPSRKMTRRTRRIIPVDMIVFLRGRSQRVGRVGVWSASFRFARP